MTEQKLVDNLLSQAEKDFQTAEALFANKSYTYTLFFGQLTLEKILKALIVKKKNIIYPPLHSLAKLAQIAGINLSKSQRAELEEITSYNIKARYDDIKLSFYKKATPAYSTKWLNKIKEWQIWLKSQF